jgi:hypothetical protein
MNSWQVSSMMHLPSTVHQNPTMKNNFDATCNFLPGEVASLQTLNTSTTGTNRTVAAISTQSNQKSKSKEKTKDSSKRGKSNKKKAEFPKKADKFNKDNPAAYVTAAVWKSMYKEEQQAAREKRREEGIPSRNVSTITTSQKTTTFADAVEGRHYDTDQPAGNVSKATTVQVATLEQLQPTQTEAQGLQGQGHCTDSVGSSG